MYCRNTVKSSVFVAFTSGSEASVVIPPCNGLWSGVLQTVEAEIDEHGKIRLLEPLTVTHPSRVLVTILPSHPKEENETALLSVASLAVDWNRKEEDEAWAHLQ